MKEITLSELFLQINVSQPSEKNKLCFPEQKAQYMSR